MVWAFVIACAADVISCVVCEVLFFPMNVCVYILNFAYFSGTGDNKGKWV